MKQMNFPRFGLRPWRRGRTLIELIVAMALSLLILLGVGSLFLSANQTSRLATGLSGAEEGGAYVLTLLGNAIRRGGYSEIVGKDWSTSVSRANLLYSGPNIRGCTNALFTGGANSTTCAGAGTLGDSLAVWFQADSVVGFAEGETLDCLGNRADLQDISDPSFKRLVAGGQVRIVRNEYFLSGTSLMCRGGVNAPLALVGNVVDFKVYYGFDDLAYSQSGAPSSTVSERPTGRSIRDADFINAQPSVGIYSPWDFVVSAHVCVTLITEDTGLTAGTAAGVTTYLNCPQTAADAAGPGTTANVLPADRGAIRRSFSEVFSLRTRVAPTPANPI